MHRDWGLPILRVAWPGPSYSGNSLPCCCMDSPLSEWGHHPFSPQPHSLSCTELSSTPQAVDLMLGWGDTSRGLVGGVQGKPLGLSCWVGEGDPEVSLITPLAAECVITSVSFVFIFCSQGVPCSGSPSLPHAALRPAGKPLPLFPFRCCSRCCCLVSRSPSPPTALHPPPTQNPPCPLLKEVVHVVTMVPLVYMVLVQAGEFPPPQLLHTPSSGVGISLPPS